MRIPRLTKLSLMGSLMMLPPLGGFAHAQVMAEYAKTVAAASAGSGPAPAAFAPRVNAPSATVGGKPATIIVRGDDREDDSYLSHSDQDDSDKSDDEWSQVR